MNDQTLLFRQAHPNFVVEGMLTSQAFTPFPKDQGNLSVYDGDQLRSEERRVGKECRSRWSPYH